MNVNGNIIYSSINWLTSIQDKMKDQIGNFQPLIWVYMFLFFIVVVIILWTLLHPERHKVHDTPNFNIFFQFIDRVGIFRINTKLVVPLIFCLIIIFSSGVEQTQAIQADKYAMSENSTAEDAFTKMALDELLLNIFKAETGVLEYDGASFTRTIQILEILHETGQESRINETIRSAILSWVEEEREPKKAYTVNSEPIYEDNLLEREINGSLVTVNEPVLVEQSNEDIEAYYWWGTIERSLDAARIMKLLGGVPEEVLVDLRDQINTSFGGSDPVWSSTHIDFSKTYAAFVTAYEYELFDMFEEYGYPRLDTEAVTLIDAAGREDYSPVTWGEVLGQGVANLTFHSGYEQSYNISSGDPLTIILPTLEEWFDSNLTVPVPYQTITVDWIPCGIPNNEELSTALDLGLVREVYIELDPVDEDYVDELAYFNEYFELEQLQRINQTIEVYRYLDWNDETLWYEMEVVVSDATNGEVIQTTYMNPADSDILLEMDLSDQPQLQVDVNVRQALHNLKCEMDNEKISIPLEGWKNETCINFDYESISYTLNDVNGTLVGHFPQKIITEEILSSH